MSFKDAVGAPPPAAETKATRRRGQRAELTEDLIAVMERALRQGLPIDAAVGLVAVSPKTMSNWMAEGADDACPDPMKRELFIRLHMARANQALEGVQYLKDFASAGGTAGVQAIKVLLSAQNSALWGDKTTQKIDVTHRDETPTATKFLTTEELETMAAIQDAAHRRSLLGPGDAEG